MTQVLDSDGVWIGKLDADDAADVVALIEGVYGNSYPLAWAYDPEVIESKIHNGEIVSFVGRDTSGSAIGHVAFMKEPKIPFVVHAGAAVVSEAARGHHLFTRLKAFGSQWAQESGYLGVFSEATAAHPYSQKANVQLGASETGFLLGWMSSDVANNAAAGRTKHRESVAIFYLKTNDGPDRPIFAPERHRGVITDIVAKTGIHGVVAEAPSECRAPRTSSVHVATLENVNRAIISVQTAGEDIAAVLQNLHKTLMIDDGCDVVYVDFPLEHPETEIVLDRHLDDVTFGFAGIFPNRHAGGDVLRLQALHAVDIFADDIATASPYGQALLDYVIADVDRTHANR